MARLSLDLDRLTGRGYVLRFCKLVDAVNDSLPDIVLERLDAVHDKILREIDGELNVLVHQRV